ncbi:MAG: hypothetical protein ABW169_10120 [Sphingobium sp.]
MIDNFSLLLTHGLILLACWRLLSRADLDSDNPVEPRGFLAALRRKDVRPKDVRPKDSRDA